MEEKMEQKVAGCHQYLFLCSRSSERKVEEEQEEQGE
jgi:hypothetical protein